MIRRILLGVAGALSVLWRLLPEGVRRMLFTSLFVVESRGDAGSGMSRLFIIRDKLDWVINERAITYGRGEHPKHRLTNYHQFFVDHIEPGSRVLDVGCGYGAVARTIARQVPDSIVLGVELDNTRYLQAVATDNPANLSFANADARNGIIPGKWDVVVMSNVLEHIEDRTGLLRDLVANLSPAKILIRVPLFERDWMIPMRQELGIPYFSDATHFVEHRLSDFTNEMNESGLRIREIFTCWGETWADCRPVTGERNG